MYNVAIIGYGYWGPKLARNFQNSNYFNVRYIIDKSKKNLSNAKINFPSAQLYRNYELIKKKICRFSYNSCADKISLCYCKIFFKKNSCFS